MTEPICRKSTDGVVMFWCPGCETYHGVWTENKNDLGANWKWNGSLEKPTFKPSILVKGTRPITDDEAKRILAGEKIEPEPTICHSFVTDGKIKFLDDCTHKLAGQTVELKPDE